jgi:regulator of protease activity HflC (stomatin/prohibitin superfamily)
MQIRLQSESMATDRRARAAGESARFLAPLAAYHAQPDVFMTRRRLEVLDAALGDLRQLILVPREARLRANIYLGLDPASTLLPTPLR